MLSLLGGDDAISDLGEVSSDHIRTFDERVEGLPGDEGSGAPRAQSPRNVPGVGRDEAHPTLGNLQRPRGYPVGRWCRFEAFRCVGGEDLLEPVGEPGTFYLGLCYLLCGVGQCSEAEPGVAQSVKAVRHFWVWRQVAQSAQDLLPIILRYLHPQPLLGHLEGSTRGLSERRICVRHGGDERREVKQGLVHIKDTNSVHNVFLPPKRFAEISPSREPRQAEMLTRCLQGAVLTSEARRAKRADQLECYLGAALQAERLACLVRGSRLSVEHLTQSHGLLDQLGVRLRALFAADAQVVFQADPHVAA